MIFIKYELQIILNALRIKKFDLTLIYSAIYGNEKCVALIHLNKKTEHSLHLNLFYVNLNVY
jgi:hypothetical protein